MKLSSLTRCLLCQASVPAASAMATLSLESSASSGKTEQSRRCAVVLTDTQVLRGCGERELLMCHWGNRQIPSRLGGRGPGSRLGCQEAIPTSWLLLVQEL